MPPGGADRWRGWNDGRAGTGARRERPVPPGAAGQVARPERPGGTAGTGGAIAAPIILSLATNVTSLTPSDSLVVTAVVTHPQGIAQVIGGTLLDPPAGGTYGAFQVSTTAGSYSLTLTWSQIKTVRDITTPVGGAGRTFRAQFFDQAGT